MPDAPPPSRRPRRREDVVFRRVGGDWLLFDPRTRQIHVLNLSAALVWSFCTGEHEVGEITREVTAAFDAPETPPGADRRERAPAGPEAVDPVRDVLERFRAAGLLEE